MQFKLRGATYDVQDQITVMLAQKNLTQLEEFLRVWEHRLVDAMAITEGLQLRIEERGDRIWLTREEQQANGEPPLLVDVRRALVREDSQYKALRIKELDARHAVRCISFIIRVLRRSLGLNEEVEPSV